MGQIKFIVGFLMVGLFAVAILNYAFNFGIDNDAKVKLSDDADMVLLNSSIQTSSEQFSLQDANNTAKAIWDSETKQGDQLLQGSGQFKLGPVNAIAITKNITTTGFKKIFGNDTGFGILLTSLFGMIVFIGALYVWKAIRGEP